MPHLQAILKRVRALAGLSGDDLAALSRSATHVKLRRGEILLRQGEAADAIYIVVTGRFYVEVNGRVIAEISSGEPIGEIAFFSGGTRTANVVAARDSEVLELSRDSYEALSINVPAVPQTILRSLAERLGKATLTAPALHPKMPRTIALCPSGGSEIPHALIEKLTQAIVNQGGTIAISRGDLPGGADTADEASVSSWLLGREKEIDHMLLVVGAGDDVWDRTALRQSDALLLAGCLSEANAGRVPTNDLERYALDLFLPSNRTLILWRERYGEPIHSTAGWLANRPVHLHHHLSLDSTEDFARIARFVSGKALGLVLAGGGALGCAHLGVARALREAGVGIDIYGGTSAGAAIAIALASGTPIEEVMDGVEKIFLHSRALRHFTIPLYSVFDHHHFDAELKRHYGAFELEDLLLNAYAVSTNLTSNAMHLHRHGPAWAAVRASGSIPAVLPPFVTDEGEVLVDGAVLDNLPLAAMRELKGGPNIVVSLTPESDWRVEAPYADLPPRGRLARELAFRRHDQQAFPRILEVVTRSMFVTSRRTMRETDLAGDVLLVPPAVESMRVLDWHLGRQQEEAAYCYTVARLEDAGGFDSLMKNGSNEDAVAAASA